MRGSPGLHPAGNTVTGPVSGRRPVHAARPGLPPLGLVVALGATVLAVAVGLGFAFHQDSDRPIRSTPKSAERIKLTDGSLPVPVFPTTAAGVSGP